MFHRRNAVFVAGLLCLAIPSTVAAAVIVDTGTPTDVGFGSALVNNGSRFQRLAAQFTLDRPANLTAIDGFLETNRLARTFHIALLSNASAAFGQTVPGTVLFRAQATSSSLNYRDWAGLSGINWAVSAGTYWAVFSVDAGDTFDGFMPNRAPSPVISEAFLNQGSGGQWQLKEPGLGVRILGELGDLPPPPPPPPAVVPEPGSWAMLIAGFGLIGAMQRRRQAFV